MINLGYNHLNIPDGCRELSRIVCENLCHIMHYEKFYLLPQCLQKSIAAEASQSICMWKRDKY